MISGTYSILKHIGLFLLLASCTPLLINAQETTPRIFEKDHKENPVIDNEFSGKLFASAVFDQVDGNPIRLNGLKGKIVILDFWQTWCGPCLASFRGFQKAKERWPDKIEILAASPDWADNKRKIRRFIRDHDYNFSFILAYDLEKELRLASIPYKIIFGPDGNLIRSESGAKGEEGEFEAIKELVETYF